MSLSAVPRMTIVNTEGLISFLSLCPSLIRQHIEQVIRPAFRYPSRRQAVYALPEYLITDGLNIKLGTDYSRRLLRPFLRSIGPMQRSYGPRVILRSDGPWTLCGSPVLRASRKTLLKFFGGGQPQLFVQKLINMRSQLLMQKLINMRFFKHL